jgi:glycosyltransferase involved in cell wall biosynthesis
VNKARLWQLSNLRFLPYQEADALPALLASADLAVVSLKAAAEGQVAPSKLYGHLAAASPVAAICDPSSYLRNEILRAGCGAAFSSGESEPLAAWILQLSEDRGLARELGAAGRRHLLATATPSLAIQAYAELLARHLPLDIKSYAQPVLEDALPLPEPSPRGAASPSSRPCPP